MDLRRLQYFLTLSEHLHFGQTAARLGISQPALSQHVQRLEEEFGTSLLERTSRAVTLTPAGAAVIGPLRQCLSAYDEARTAAREADRDPVHPLRIGFPGSEVGLVLAPLLRKVSEYLPYTRVEVVETCCERQTADLSRGRVDVGFMHLPVLDSGVSVLPVRQDEFVVLLPRGHPSGGAERVSLRSLAEEPFIDFRPRCPAYVLALSRLLQRAGFSPQTEYGSAQVSTTLDMVASRLGVAVVPSSTVPRTSDAVTARPLEPAGEALQVAFVWQTGSPAPHIPRIQQLMREFSVSVPPRPMAPSAVRPTAQGRLGSGRVGDGNGGVRTP